MSTSLALARSYDLSVAPSTTKPQFRVIEGGASHASQAARFTARERLVYGVAAVLLMCMLAFTWRLSDLRTQHRVQEALANVSYELIVVHPGDTIWDIAQSHPVEGCSTQELARHLRSINNLEDANLTVGMRLNVPQQC